MSLLQKSTLITIDVFPKQSGQVGKRGPTQKYFTGKHLHLLPRATGKETSLLT